jgi:hypothetical protein
LSHTPLRFRFDAPVARRWRLGASSFVIGAALAGPCGAQVPTVVDLWFLPLNAVVGSFWIKASTDTNKCLEVDGAWLSGNDRAQLFFCYGRNGTVPGTVQEWLLLPAGRDAAGALRWRLANREFSKCLDVAPVRSSVSVQPCNSNPGQLWEFIPNRSTPSVSRQFSLRSVADGRVIERTAASDGSALRLAANMDAPAQAWQFANNAIGARPQVSTSNYPVSYRIELRAASGKVLDVQGAGLGDNTTIQAWDWHGGSNQKFAFFSAADPARYPAPRASGFLSLFARHSDKAMEVYGFSVEPGARVEQWTWLGLINQAWVVLPAKEVEFVHLVNANSGLALQTSNDAIGNGTAMTQRPFNGSTQQAFRLVRLP